MSENELKQNIAQNLISLRREHDMTQADLAEKISYSDKSVSKWERAEGLPDIVVLTQIAEIFGVTVNDIISEKQVSEQEVSAKSRKSSRQRKVLITLLSVGLVWFVAALVYVTLRITLPAAEWLWLIFIVAIPLSAIVCVVFTHLWWGMIPRFLSVSLLVWGITVTAHLSTLVKLVQNITLIYIASAVFQVLVILWYVYQNIKHQKTMLNGKIKKD